MHISTKIYYGPNTYSRKPIVLLTINIHSLTDINITNYCKEITNIFPNFVDSDLSVTTDVYLYFGKVISNFAFKLINENDGLLTSHGTKVDNKIILSWVEFDNLEVTLKSLQLVINIFVTLSQNGTLEDSTIKNVLENYSKIAKKHNNYSKELLSASNELDIPSFEYFNNTLYRQYGWGKNSRVFRSSSPMEDSYHGVSISMNKVESKKLLKSIGMPIVKDAIIHSKEHLSMAIKSIDYPCVVKPIRGAKAIGIRVNILNYTELNDAYDYAKKSSFGDNPIMIEKFIEGNPHRLLVVRGKFLGSIKKTPPILIGDGKSSIRKIIEKINQDRLNPLINKDNLRPIQIDDELINYIKKFKLELDDIIEDQIEIKLSTTFTYTHHGASVDNTTDITHPHIIQMAESIAKVTNIDILAIDYITTDISKSFRETGGAICEYNHFPGFGSLELWDTNSNRLHVASQIIGKDVSRIPVILIIINNAEVVQLHSWIKSNLTQDGLGWICNKEAYIGQLPLNTFEETAWDNVKMLLRQKTLEKLLIICTPEDVINKGLPLDVFEEIYVDNISDDWNIVCENATSSLKYFTKQNELYDYFL